MAATGKKSTQERCSGTLADAWRRCAPLLPWVATAVAVCGLTVCTWGRVGDPIIDLGREVDVPWQILRGAVLYRDVTYIYGPLSPYLNALLLFVFGLRFNAILLGGYLAAALGAVLVYRVARRFLAPAGALVAVNIFLLESVFQHYCPNGSFNFILPYSFPAVHGMLLSLACLLLLFRYFEEDRRSLLALAGLVAGLATLCKVEIAAALVACVACSAHVLQRPVWKTPKESIRDGFVWALPFVTVVCCGYVPFFLTSSINNVLAGNMLRTNLTNVGGNDFARDVFLGGQDVGGCLWMMARSLVLYGVSVGLVLVSAKLIAKSGYVRRWCGIALGAAVFVGLCVAVWFLPNRLELHRGLPILCMGVGLAAFVPVIRGVSDTHTRSEQYAVCALALFAFLAMLRILLNAGAFHYGFYMTVPGLVLLSVFLLHLVPRWLRLPAAEYLAFACMMAVLLLLHTSRSFVVSSLPRFRAKTVVFSGPRGVLRGRRRPSSLGACEAMAYLQDVARPGDSLVVIPEGATINFLLAMPNPLSYNIFVPVEVNRPGIEDLLIHQFKEHDVDFVLIIDHPMNAYGFRGPGVDYARKLMRFIADNYSLIAQFGTGPYHHENIEGGAVLLRRSRNGASQRSGTDVFPPNG